MKRILPDKSFFGYQQIIVAIFLYLVLLPENISGQDFDVNKLSRAVVQVISPVNSGSGIIILKNDEVYVMTNRHVVEGHKNFTINALFDVNEPARPAYNAELHLFSPDYDVAILKITSDIDSNYISAEDIFCSGPGSADCIPHLTFEDNLGDLSRGDDVALLGYPGIGENELVYSRGIISSVKYEEYNEVRMPAWFRTSAGMAPGSSGGLAINMAGKVIGIPSYVRSENLTGGRIGSILSAQVVLAALEADNVLSSWEEFSKPMYALDYNLNPEFGDTLLAAGFLPDPYSVAMTSGGVHNVSHPDSECTGYAASRPDYLINWTGDSERLLIFFKAGDETQDATILVNAPDGEWYCNDDINEGTLNPGVGFENPQEGQYHVWVGSYEEENYIEGHLFVTEGTGEETAEPNVNLEPLFGERSLVAGFSPDPFRITVKSGGTIDAGILDLEEGCLGFVSAAPDYRINWSGEGSVLNIYFVPADAGEDATLLVNLPNGSWICNDDANEDTLNPLIQLSAPQEGQYDIWIGSYAEEVFTDGFLIISELDPEGL